MFVRLGRIEEKIAGRVGLDFLQTHPSSSNRVRVSCIRTFFSSVQLSHNKFRIQKLEQILPEAYAVLAANPDCAAIHDQLQLFRAASAGHEAQEVGVGGSVGDAELF